MTCLVVCCLPKHHMEVADTYLQSNLVLYWSADRRPTARTTFPWAMPHADKKKEKSPKRKISIQSMDLVATIDGLEIQRTSWDTCFFCLSCLVWKLFDIIHCCIKRFSFKMITCFWCDCICDVLKTPVFVWSLCWKYIVKIMLCLIFDVHYVRGGPTFNHNELFP